MDLLRSSTLLYNRCRSSKQSQLFKEIPVVRLKTLIRSFFIFTIVAFATSPANAQTQLPADLIEKIDKVATDALTRTGVPSASIAVVKDGQVVYVKAYGDALLEPKTPATTEMRYSIGSISKQFTAAAILLLQEQGKLSLDDKVGKFIPNLTRANEVTIRQLLSHTSGYQDYWPQDYVMPMMLQPVTAQKIMDTWAKIPLDFEPGARWQYSNTNYVIAGVIVEKAARMPLLQFLSEKVFTPLAWRWPCSPIRTLFRPPAKSPRGSLLCCWRPMIRRCRRSLSKRKRFSRAFSTGPSIVRFSPTMPTRISASRR